MGERGFTILEVMIASVIAGVVAAGTLMSFVAAGRMMDVRNNMSTVEATTLGQDSMEHFRNHIACQPPWFDVNCTYIWPAGWFLDPFIGGGGSESILGAAARRCYQVTSNDCGTGIPNSCFIVDVRVCWTGDLVGACPC